jgi:hypothetical protein
MEMAVMMVKMLRIIVDACRFTEGRRSLPIHSLGASAAAATTTTWRM